MVECREVGEQETNNGIGRFMARAKRTIRWGVKIAGFMGGMALRGVLLSLLFGLVCGLVIAFVGAQVGYSQETLMLAGAASGYASGVIAMIIVLTMSILKVREKRSLALAA